MREPAWPRSGWMSPLAMCGLLCVVFCVPALGQVTVTPVAAPVQVRSLGDADTYVEITGRGSWPQTLSIQPGTTSTIEWLIPGSVRLHRLDARTGAFVPIDSTYDPRSGLLTADVPEAGTYGVFGLSRAQHLFKAQSIICAGHPGLTARDWIENPLMDAARTHCPTYLCLDVDVLAWTRDWSTALGRTVAPHELAKVLQRACACCQSGHPVWTDFPECLDRPQPEFVSLESELLKLPLSRGISRCRDSDGDTVCDIFEIAIDLDPLSKDTDADGLEDGWEVSGFDGDGDGIREVDLAAIGTDPRHKDLLVEIDWTFNDENDDGLRNGVSATELPDNVNDLCNDDEASYGPIRDLVDRAVAVFADAPVENPDGVDGINLIVAVSPNGIPEKEAQSVIDELWIQGSVDVCGAQFSPAFHTFKGEHADLLPPEISRYNLWLSETVANETWTGFAEGIPGANFVVSVGFMCETDNLRGTWVQNAGPGLSEDEVISDLHLGTFLHELGHSLGLFHGGSLDPDCGPYERDYEPNYHSVMNHHHQFPGTAGKYEWDPAPADCPDPPDPPGGEVTETQPVQSRLFDAANVSPHVMCFTRGAQRDWAFSTGTRKPIKEDALRENGGIPDVDGLGGDVDWDGNGTFQQIGTVKADLDFDDCDDQVLTDNDDWSSMQLRYW